uniref:Carboxypeptidase n=1 Tax=Anthurium amnicola TaxID=1678845 RepID=A0A1D1ZBJ3_9ARAE
MAAPRSHPVIPLFLVLVLAAFLGDSAAAGGQWEEAQLVTGLPGQPAVGFRHYAGYVGVRPGDEKALFYWFFEAEDGANKKPLVLWLNGGPGCSSVAYGAAQELGPFLKRTSGPNLTVNPYAWNKVANLLFVEAPVGVGFSYTNRSADLAELGDRVTAQDSHSFLLNWFHKFPRFKSHEFYIAGESYAGHYIPQLAERIYEGNQGASKDSYINFKGFMMGNAVVNDETDQLGMVEYAWSHAIISDTVYHSVRRGCADFNGSDAGKACSSAVRAFMQAYDGIDIYSIYTPVCLSSLSQQPNKNKIMNSRKNLPVAPRTFSEHNFWHSRPRLPSAGYDPCTEDYVEKYFNREDVQKALHANLTKLSYTYTPCSGVIEKWNDSPPTVLPIIRKLIDAGLRVWIYSGDTDGRVPVTSTRYSINAMGLTVKEEWRAWYHKRQVAGWVVEYREGLTFATLRGAGHQVPVFVPDRSLSLLSHFLAGNPLPASRR